VLLKLENSNIEFIYFESKNEYIYHGFTGIKGWAKFEIEKPDELGFGQRSWLWKKF
jgi:hypothetical protein